MAGKFEGSTEIDRPIEEVFAFLADGTNEGLALRGARKDADGFAGRIKEAIESS